MTVAIIAEQIAVVGEVLNTEYDTATKTKEYHNRMNQYGATEMEHTKFGNRTKQLAELPPEEISTEHSMSVQLEKMSADSKRN